MMDNSTLQETARILQRQWGLKDDPESSWDTLKTALRHRILELLEDDFGGLVNAMYRLDVAEHRFKEALDAGAIPSIAGALVEIVLDREMQRLATRRRYSARNDNLNDKPFDQ